MNALSLFEVELNGTTPGTDYDRLVVNGTVDVTNAILSATLGYTPNNTDVLYILSNDSADAIVGTFASAPEGGTVTLGAYTATITYLADVGGPSLTGGNDVALFNFESDDVAAVPEPSSIALALCGLVGLVIALATRSKHRV